MKETILLCSGFMLSNNQKKSHTLLLYLTLNRYTYQHIILCNALSHNSPEPFSPNLSFSIYCL